MTTNIFDGGMYDPAEDDERLTGQILRIYDLMKDHHWRTLGEIEALTGDPQASISAQLRHLRKPRFGSYRLEVRARGIRSGGLNEYRILEPDPTAAVTTAKRAKKSGFLEGMKYAARIVLKAGDMKELRADMVAELLKAARGKKP